MRRACRYKITAVLHEPTPDDLALRCSALMKAAAEGPGEERLFPSLARLFASLRRAEAFEGLYPGFESLFAAFLEALAGGSAEGVKDCLTMIYSFLHSHDSAYAAGEREELDASGGYWCHAGGLSPLWRAEGRITPPLRLADYGAGNGFQGLLFQYLYPHRRTTLIELSGEMVEKGRRLQAAMGIASPKVEWIHGSVADVPPDRFDFIYVYRPLRPEGEAGRAFYTWFAQSLAAVDHEVTIFSIADCLKDFLDPSFTVFYDDGQLACFTNRPR